MRILIIGYGNPLRSDDGFGWRAAERLSELIRDPEIEVLALHQLTPELMDSLSRAEFAIFIDACEGPEPGLMAERQVAPQSSGQASFTHHVTPEALLGGARLLYGRAVEAIMITVAGADFSLGAELSAGVAARLEEVIAAVLRRIEERG